NRRSPCAPWRIDARRGINAISEWISSFWWLLVDWVNVVKPNIPTCCWQRYAFAQPTPYAKGHKTHMELV
ncbi:MAG: hypothetical protein RKP20_03580, partial [Candidatus Competibacter sp.]|nr:hypothetical protein [Candidatus Competibacter sp.]